MKIPVSVIAVVMLLADFTSAHTGANCVADWCELVKR